MKTNGKHEVIAGIARHSLVLAALLAVAVALIGTSFAQSNGAAAPQPADAKTAQVAQAAASSPAAPAAKAPRGNGEGIQIHGQWTIEVRNRDGSVAKHVEFENALDPGSFWHVPACWDPLRQFNPGAWEILIYGENSSGVGQSPCATRHPMPARSARSHYRGADFGLFCFARPSVTPALLL